MREELDYRIEAANQTEFAAHFAGHPFIRIPAVDPATSTKRVLTTEWVDGIGFDEFRAAADEAARRRAGEIDLALRPARRPPHRRVQRRPASGQLPLRASTAASRSSTSVWSSAGPPGEWAQLAPSLDAIVVHRDPERLVVAMEDVGFLQPGHGLPPQAVYDYVSAPYLPYLTDEFTFTRTFVRDALAPVIDLKGPHAEVIAKLNMPAELRHPRPGGVGRERDPRQARGHRAVAGDAARVPPRRTPGDTARRAERRGVVGRGATAAQHDAPR